MSLPIDRVLEAERLGFDSVWTSEAYGSDAVTPAAWVLARTTRIKVGTAIMQMPARTPAMTAMTLDVLSGGRFVLGIGPSGPQVVEGWHGVAYGKPLLRTGEYIDIIRKILERNEPLTYAGEHYQIPFAGPGATGLGKPGIVTAKIRTLEDGREPMSEMGSSATETGEAIPPCTSASPRKRQFGQDHAIHRDVPEAGIRLSSLAQ
jgi:hypothetical protein